MHHEDAPAVHHGSLLQRQYAQPLKPLPFLAALCLDNESSWMVVLAHGPALHESGNISPEYLKDSDDRAFVSRVKCLSVQAEHVHPDLGSELVVLLDPGNSMP